MLKSKDVVLHYGETTLSNFIPQKVIDNGQFLPLIYPEKLPVIKNVEQNLSDALEKPVGDQKPLSILIKENYAGGNLSIIVDDHDRPNTHTRLLLPILIEKLTVKYKIPSEKIKVVIATGTHRPSTAEELKNILGVQMFGKLNYVIHKCRENNVEAGKIDGLTVKINETVFNSDIIIPLTDVENHYFAGIAGGPKALCPGVCDMKTITYEHLKMFGDCGFAHNVDLGSIDGNPVFETKKKIVKAVIETLKKNKREVYTITSIIDTAGDLVYLKGGETFESHRKSAEILKNVWTVNIKERADIVISGAGHWGVNLYQMGKATHCAYHAVKKGGIVLNVAPCNQGWGNEEFKNLMKVGMGELNGYPDKSEGIKKALVRVINAVKKDFKIGKQKPVDLFQILHYVGWGNLHIIQDGIIEEDHEFLPFVFWGNKSEPVEKRLELWLEKYLGNKTISVVDNPNFLIKSI
ncbi:MAG: lactate racemase domain-containing protein [Elusimicrobiota bacterium]|nr:lactate racemase domain-containing protein [Elusimicrobiota bacterium]